MKKIVKILIFVFIFCILWDQIFKILWIPKNKVAFSYDEPENSIDVAYIGPSTVDTSFNVLLAYDLYGFTTQLLASSMQPFQATKYIIEENRKRQNPQVYIIDILQLSYELSDTLTDEFIRQVTDQMKFSRNRIDAINELLKYTDKNKKDYINYYFSFFMYHNAWKDIDISYFNSNIYKSYNFYKQTTEIVPQPEYIWLDSIEEVQSIEDWMYEMGTLSEIYEHTLIDLLDYIKENDLNVLFVIPKRDYWFIYQLRLNDAVSIIEKNGFNVLNFNKIDEVGIDASTDFYDSGHLNVYGATKYTLYLSKYINDHYDLNYHKDDKTYASWNEEYNKFKESFQKETGNDFDELLVKYNS